MKFYKKCLTGIALSLLLTGCGNVSTTEVKGDLDSFLKACGNGDYAIAVDYIAPSEDQEGYAEDVTDDTSGLAWSRLPDEVSAKLPDTPQVRVEVTKYISEGLSLIYDEYVIEDITIEDDTAKAIVTGKGPFITWVGIEKIYQQIEDDTKTEFLDDYSYYKEKIEESSQDEVFKTIQSKVASTLSKDLIKEIDALDENEYIQEITLKKYKTNGEVVWKVVQISEGVQTGE